MKLAELVIRLSANTANLQRDFEQARGSAQRFVGGVQRALSGLVPMLSAGGVAYALKKLVTDTADYGDQVIKASQKTGVGVEQLSALRFAAKLSGVEFEGLQKGLEIFAKNIAGVSAHSGTQERPGCPRDLDSYQQRRTQADARTLVGVCRAILQGRR